VIPARGELQSTADLVRSLCEEPTDIQIFTVLIAFQECLSTPDAHDLAVAAILWLSGDEIDDDQAHRLSTLGGHRIGSRLPDEAAVERTFIVLGRMLRQAGRTLVICLDQVDNLDDEQVAGLMTFLHALLDHAENLAVICSGVAGTMADFRERRIIAEAAWDRVALYTVELNEIRAEQASALVRARLREFFKPFATVPEIESELQRDADFPLGASWLATRLSSAKQLRPRDVISWARDAWERVQDRIDSEGGLEWLQHWKRETNLTPVSRPPMRIEDVIDDAVRAKLDERRAQRLLEPNSLPPDADNLATLTRKLLDVCTGRGYSFERWEQRPGPRKGAPRTYDFVAHHRDKHGQPVTTGVVFAADARGNALTGQLKRLAEDAAPPRHALLVSDRRRGLRLGPKAQEHMDRLTERGAARFSEIRLNLADVVELDAIQSVMGLAQVGDLEVEHPVGSTRTLRFEEVCDSLHRLDVFRPHPLLHELLTEEVVVESPPESPPPLTNDVVRAGIAGYLSWRAGASASEVAKKIADDNAVSYDKALLAQVIGIADDLHRAGHLHSTPQDGDRYMWWLGGTV
jgi:hypothetical protein